MPQITGKPLRPHRSERVLSSSKSTQKLFAPLVGERCWGARIRSDRRLALQFGKPLEPRKTRGEWHLVLLSGCWRIEHRGRIAAGSDDNANSLTRALPRYLRNRFSMLEFWPSRFDAAFVFENDVVLRTFQTRDEYSWWLFAPPNSRLVVGPGADVKLQDQRLAGV